MNPSSDNNIARVIADHEAAIRRLCWLDQPGDTFTPTVHLVFTQGSDGQVVTQRQLAGG